jgi:hypothetical protein
LIRAPRHLPSTRRVLLALLVPALLAAGCGEMDEAELVEPGEPVVEAEPGQLRVLRHRDDPTAGDRWLDVLTPVPAVVVPTDRFREEGSRQADEDEAADLRLLYEAVARGRTLLVRLNCRACDRGVPETDPDDTEVLVWDFVVDGAGDRDAALGGSAATPGRVHTSTVGEHVVVVRDADAVRVIDASDGGVLRLVARHVPEDGARVLVDVFTAVGAGETTLAYGDDEYPVRIS